MAKLNFSPDNIGTKTQEFLDTTAQLCMAQFANTEVPPQRVAIYAYQLAEALANERFQRYEI